MNQNKYPIYYDRNKLSYEFLSLGPKGTIKKVIYFQKIGHNTFNLAYGDWDYSIQKFDDKARTNNNDREKVLATVASAVIQFFRSNKEAIVYAKASTPARTRLYQMGISSNWHEINQILKVKGRVNGKWLPFEKNKNYEAFLARAKKTLYF